MSYNTIKQTLENYLNTNVTDEVIKWGNTSIYTLDGDTLTKEEVDDLNTYIEVKLIPIDDIRGEMSSSTPIKFMSFFQLNVCQRVGKGTGNMYDLIDRLGDIFRETNVSDVVFDRTEILGETTVGEFIVTPYRFQYHLWA